MSALVGNQRKYILGISLLAVVYFAAGKLGLALAFENRSATLVWPPTGIGLAALLALGKRFWPGIFLGAFAINLTTTNILVSSLSIAVGNTLESLLASWLIGRFAAGMRVFEQPRGVFSFLFLAGAGAVASASVGVVSLGLVGEMPWIKIAQTWWTWWLGDVIGALLITPPLILWYCPGQVLWTKRQVFLVAFLFSLVIVAGLAVFGDHFPLVNQNYPLVFIFLPLLIWIAFQFGPREVATANLLLAVIAIHGTLNHLGPFKAESEHLSLLILQTFLGITGITTLLFAGLAHGLNQTKMELEQRVLERTGKLEQAHKRLRQSERLAAIGEMITGLAHESRNALQRTHACLELLTLKVEERPELLALVQDIQKAQDFLVHLYEEVRSYAAPLQLRQEKIDLHGLLQETWKLLGPERKGRTVTLNVEAHAFTRAFLGDPMTLQQVFRNILENSLSLCPDPVNLHVSWSEKRVGGYNALEMTFRDNGPGFPLDLKDKVFEPFFTTKIRGTGLGLAIAKRIVEAHGGIIQIGCNGHPGAEIALIFYREKA